MCNNAGFDKYYATMKKKLVLDITASVLIYKKHPYMFNMGIQLSVISVMSSNPVQARYTRCAY